MSNSKKAKLALKTILLWNIMRLRVFIMLFFKPDSGSPADYSKSCNQILINNYENFCTQ